MSVSHETLEEHLSPHYLQPLLDGLLDLLEQEREHLNSGKIDKLELFAKKKMQSLAQLNLFIRKGNTRYTTRLYSRELRKIDELLTENVRKLQFRIKAIGEIAETIESAVSEADSDGTYQAGNYRVSAS
jgi:flagellar biosynthesis/type III secretory pathway chaperone